MGFLDICISFYSHFLLCSSNCQPRTFLDFRYACWNGTHVLKEGRKNALLLSVELWGCNTLSVWSLAFLGYCQNTHPRTVVLVGLFHRKKNFFMKCLKTDFDEKTYQMLYHLQCIPGQLSQIMLLQTQQKFYSSFPHPPCSMCTNVDRVCMAQ